MHNRSNRIRAGCSKGVLIMKNQTWKRRAGVTATAAAAAVALPLTMALPANAAPGKLDCGVSVQLHCHKTWDRETTKSFYEAQNSFWWQYLRDVYVDKLGLKPGVIEGNRAIDRFESATADAVLRDGCLQATYRKDGKGGLVWGYTEDTEICR